MRRCLVCGQYTALASDSCERCGESPEVSEGRRTPRLLAETIGAYGARPGTPWEARGPDPAILRLGQTVAAFAFRPRSAFAEMYPDGDLGPAFSFSFLLCFSMPLLGWLGWVVSLSGSRAGGTTNMLCGAAFTSALFLPSIQAFALHLFLAMTGGGRYGFEGTYRVALYSWGTASPALALPGIGIPAAAIRIAALQAVGLREVQGASGARATIVSLLPLATFFLCCMGLSGSPFRIRI